MGKIRMFLFLVVFFALSLPGKDNIVYITPGCFGNIFGYYSDNQYKHLHNLRDCCKRLGYQVRQVSSLRNLKNVAAIVCFGIPKKQLGFLSKYPIEKRILFLWEPPITKPDNYDKRYHKHFSKVYTLLDGLVDNKKYFKFYEPQPCLDIIDDEILFGEKKLCVLLTCKKAYSHPLSLSAERWKIIDFFSKLGSDDFDLYGREWSKKDCIYYKGVSRSRPECFKNYKFVFCYENAKNLHGYITSHKILFPMIAKSVPIRWSEENVAGYIPKNCFISRCDFESYGDLYSFIKNMDEKTYNKYLDNIRKFLKSDAVLLFSCENFAYIFLDAILPGFNKNVAFTPKQLEVVNHIYS
ncbi:glycosyltransferase family 10 domain-containing protein [Candidatus Dependentiae bacterium]